MNYTKSESEFIGCAKTATFLAEKIDLAADRGYGVIVEPVGRENDRAFNLYQITPALAKAAPELCEALKYIIRELDKANIIKADSIFMEMPNKVIAKVEGGSR